MPLSDFLTFSTSRACACDRQVAVDDADAALLRHRDRHPRLGDGVHRGAETSGMFSAMPAREPRRDVGVAREDRARGGDEQDVVEGEPLGELTHVHGNLHKRQSPVARRERGFPRCGGK